MLSPVGDVPFDSSEPGSFVWDGLSTVVYPLPIHKSNATSEAPGRSEGGGAGVAAPFRNPPGVTGEGARGGHQIFRTPCREPAPSRR